MLLSKKSAPAETSVINLRGVIEKVKGLAELIVTVLELFQFFVQKRI